MCTTEVNSLWHAVTSSDTRVAEDWTARAVSEVVRRRGRPNDRQRTVGSFVPAAFERLFCFARGLADDLNLNAPAIDEWEAPFVVPGDKREQR